MTPRFVRLCLVISVFATAALRAQTPAPGPVNFTAPPALPTKDDGKLYTLKLSDAPIDAVLGALEEHTGRTILRPQALPTATYSIAITKPIPRSELVVALETLLELNQVGVTPLGDRFLKVTALAQSRSEAPEMIEGSTFDLPASGKVATKVFQLDFLRVAEFIPQLANMFSPNIGGGVVILQNANAAIITDTVANLQRVETLVRNLDRPNTSNLVPKFFTLRNGAKASDLVTKLRTILSPVQAQLGTATTYSADDRSNQIILLSDPRQHDFFAQLIEKLDVKSDPNTRNEVLYLKHAEAKVVGPLLNTLVSGQNAASQRANAQSVRPGQIVLPGGQVINTPATANTPNNPGAVNVAPQPAAANTNNSFASALAGLDGSLAGSNEFSSLITIAQDERSNAIIVSGTADDIRLIKDLVGKLDVVLAQVSIEVIIAEVTLTESQKSGLSALNLTVKTDGAGNAATNGDNGRGTHITDFSGNVAGWNVTSGIVNPLAFQAALSDNGSRSNVKILQAPTIVTTHNKQAVIKSGQSQPVITGSTATPTTASTSGITTQSQVTYKEITLSLTVTPLIGDDGSIQMTIAQQVDDVISNVTIDGNQQPVIGTRSATSFITVQDGQMIVLGGLQRTKNTRSRAKIGFIYEIPILSHLLGAREADVERTELLLFVRPHVIRPMESMADTQKRIDAMTNKDQVNQYLVDPSKPSKDSLLEKIK